MGSGATLALSSISSNSLRIGLGISFCLARAERISLIDCWVKPPPANGYPIPSFVTEYEKYSEQIVKNAKVLGDALGFPTENHMIIMDLTKYELARLIGARALQLSSGAPPLVKPKLGISAIDLAQEELDSGAIPLVVLREKAHQ